MIVCRQSGYRLVLVTAACISLAGFCATEAHAVFNQSVEGVVAADSALGEGAGVDLRLGHALQSDMVEVGFAFLGPPADKDALEPRCILPERRSSVLYCPEDVGVIIGFRVIIEGIERVPQTFEVFYKGGTATPGEIVDGAPTTPGVDFQPFDPIIADYDGKPEGDLAVPFELEVYDDYDLEDHEDIIIGSKSLTLDLPSKNNLAVFILDNEIPYLSIPEGVYMAAECDGGITIPVTMLGEARQEVTVRFRTTGTTGNGWPATAGDDYTAMDSILTFQPGQLRDTVYVDVEILADGIAAGNPDEREIEAFEVILSDPINARFFQNNDITIGRIRDGCRQSLAVEPKTLVVGEGAGAEEFSVRLLAVPKGGPVTVGVIVPAELERKVFVAPSTLTFTEGNWEAAQFAGVAALQDADSNHENGNLLLVARGGGYDGKSDSILVTVIDDDNRSRMGIEGAVVRENAGVVQFRIQLDRASAGLVRVRYATLPGTASEGEDYERTSGILVFAVGQTRQQVLVPVIDDQLHEATEEYFTLELSEVEGADLVRSNGRGEIIDNDPAPTVMMSSSVYVKEGGTAKINLNLSSISGKPVVVDYGTSDVTAIAGEDYEAVPAGSVTIEPGEMGAVIQVLTQDDEVHEAREAFVVEQSPIGGRTVVVVLDNDPVPRLSIGDAIVSEDGERARLAITLEGRSAVRVGVAYATHDGTAKAGADFERVLGTLVFAPRESMGFVSVPLLRDHVVEDDEGFVVRLSSPENAELADAEGNVKIKDVPIEVSIFSGSEMESSEELVMPVRLNYGSALVVSVQFAVTGGTATSDVDYEATEGLVVFETGSTEAQVRIPLIDDDVQEGDETIEVTLSNPTNAQIGQAMATGTIVDDETAPGVQVRAIAVSQTEALFVVRLLAPVADRLTGRYRTVDGTAWAGEDYERMEGVLEFGPGETRKEVRVPLLRAQGTGEEFALMVELGDETVREDVVLGSKDTGNRARLGRSVAVHIVEAVSERMEGSLVGCMPRPFPGQRVRVSHLLSGCGMQASGERLSVWGRGAYSRLQSGGISGVDVVTASLGADYRTGGRWLMGMAVSRSEALEREGTLLQMTGWYPYVRYGGMRHSVWGLAGAGQGVVAEAADTGMRMMAAGVGGTLVRRAGARLGYEADGFWLGMDGGIGVSRVRAGLEGSVTLQDILEPYVEAAVLHSGGDAERGMGMEAGGGLRVRMGMLYAEVMSRRLVLHQEDGYGEWGYSGTVRYGGIEGLGAQVRPTWGRTHVGTLWQAERPWEVYPSDRRMELEVGYGSRVHSRSVLRPHVGMGLRDRGRDYRIGAGVQGRTGLGFSVSGLAMEHMAPYRPVSYGVTASGYMRW